MALDELRWLARQDVLGAGSVVMYGKVCQAAKVVMRPEVNIKVGTTSCSRELTYVTADGKLLKPEAIGATLVRTHWPLRRVPVIPRHEWDGPSAEWDPPMPELQQQAESIGIKVAATDSSEKLRGLVMAATIAEYETLHMEDVAAVWQASVAAMLVAEQEDKAMENAQVPALPAAEQDNKAMENAQVPALPAAERDNETVETAQVPAQPAA